MSYRIPVGATTGDVRIEGDLFVKGIIGGTLGPLGFPTYIFVGDPTSEFPDLVTSLTWLASNMSGNTTLVLTADNENISTPITINLPFNLTITSGGYGQAEITALLGVSNSALFTLESNVSFTKLIIDAGSATGTTQAIKVATDDLYVEFKDSTIVGFDKGIYSTSNSEFWVFEAIINDCKTAGVEINTSSTGARYRSMGVDYSASATYPQYIGINLVSGHSMYISTQNDTTELSHSAQTFIKKPGTGQISYTEFVVEGTIWNNVGNFKSGFDFTLQRDADIVFYGVVGSESQVPHFKLNVNASTGVTAVTTSWTKASYGYNATTSYFKKFGFADNKLTYYPTHPKDVLMWISASVTTSSQPLTLEVALVKNGQTGTTYGYQTIFLDANARAFNFSTNVYISDVALNDYIELYFRSDGSDNVTLTNMNWLGNSQ